MAVKEWLKLMDARSTSLERALAAYDMFVLHDRDGDFDDVCVSFKDYLSPPTAYRMIDIYLT